MLTEEMLLNALKTVRATPFSKNIVEEQKILELTVKNSFISLKIATQHKDGSQAQLQLQNDIVRAMKNAGAESVGIRFEELVEPTNDETIVISIASGKGGVGKSTVAGNLAVALARAGKQVGIIDADIYGFSIPIMMGIQERPEIAGEKIIPVMSSGVKVMSMGFFIEDNSPVIWRGPMLGKMLNNFITQVIWGDLDYLILDLPPGTGDIALDIHRLIPTSKEIIVTTPHPTAAYVASRAGAMGLKSNHEILGIVENMAYFKNKSTNEKEFLFGQGGGEQLAGELNTELLAKIPLAQPDIDKGFNTSIFEEHTEIGQLYRELAKKVIAKSRKNDS